MQKLKLSRNLSKSVLSCGAHTKNTVCSARKDTLYLNPEHLDLDNPVHFAEFRKRVTFWLGKKPEGVAVDLHPDYSSTKYALSLAKRYRVISVQHHHAHIVSCMVDNNLRDGRVIGVAFDGTGLGDNGGLWGAEFLLCTYKGFQRKGHLREIPLIGAEMAIRQPFRLALVWLWWLRGERFWDEDILILKNIKRATLCQIKQIWDKGLNSPLASSMGRLFDAVGCILLGQPTVKYEAELAIRTEELAQRHLAKVSAYPFSLGRQDKLWVINPLPMFKEMLGDIHARESKEKIALRFHLTVARMIKEVCVKIRQDTLVNSVALSGGVFQNALLRQLSVEILTRGGFRVYTHRKIPCHDAGISVGQAVIAGS